MLAFDGVFVIDVRRMAARNATRSDLHRPELRESCCGGGCEVRTMLLSKKQQHVLEVVRTCCAVVALVLNVVVLTRVLVLCPTTRCEDGHQAGQTQ